MEFDSTIPQADVECFLSWLEESVEGGTRYKDEQTIQLGSMILRLRSADGYFDLQEPDMQHIPVSWQTGVTESFRLLKLQKDIAASVGLSNRMDTPSIRASLVAGTDLSSDEDAFVLERSEPNGSDSGWFVGRIDSQLAYSNPANLCRISIYQAILNWPRIAGFLALPSGCRVAASSSGFDIYHEGKHLL